MNKTLARSLRFLTGMLIPIAVIWGYNLFKVTLIDWWIPICVAITLAIITLAGYKKWSVLTTSTNRLINILCHMVCIGGLGYTLLLSTNYYFRDKENPKKIAATIINKYSETKEQQQRIGRHRYKTNTTQKYYITVSFENGQAKTLSVSPSTYRRAKDNTIHLTLEKGLFGFSIIQW